MEWPQLVQLPLEDLIIKSKTPLTVYASNWYEILSGLAQSLRMLYIGTSAFNVIFPTMSVVELPQLQVLDIPVMLPMFGPRFCFLALVRLPITCDILLRINSSEGCDLQDYVDAHFGRFALDYHFRLYCGSDEFIFAPTTGPGQLRVIVKLEKLILHSFGPFIQENLRSAIKELEIESVTGHQWSTGYGYGWPARTFPNVSDITCCPTNVPAAIETTLRESASDARNLDLDSDDSELDSESGSIRSTQEHTASRSSYTLIELLAASAYQPLFPKLHTLQLRSFTLDDSSVDQYRVLSAIEQRSRQKCPLPKLLLDQSCAITSNFRAAIGRASPHTSVMLEEQVVLDVGESDAWIRRGSALLTV